MNRLAKNSIAAGLTTLLVTTGLSFSAFGADPIVAQSNSSAISGSNIAQFLDTRQCAVSSTGAPTTGVDDQPEGNLCGDGLATQGAVVVNQTASTGLEGQNGTSTADAAISPTSIPALDTIDLSTVEANIDNIQTGTALDDIFDALGPVTGPAFELLLTPVLEALQEAAIGPITEALQQQVPVSVNIGAITSTCDATPGSATGTSEVAGIDIFVDLPGDSGDITVPVNVGTTPNSPLVGGVATSEIVDGLLEGVEDTLTESLNGVLGPLAGAVDAIQQPLVDAILTQLGPALIDPLGDALTPILDGTVNQQTTGEGSIEVTALDLNIGGDALAANLARVSCGPNGVVAVDNDDDNADAVADADAQDADAVADADAQDADADANADGTPVASIADADSAADADVQASLPNAGAPNLLPFFLLGIALLAFGLAVLLNERRRLGLPSSDNLA